MLYLLGGDLRVLVVYGFHALLGRHVEVFAYALHDLVERVDGHSLLLAHLAGQLLHHALGTGKLALVDELVDLGAPVVASLGRSSHGGTSQAQ